MDVLKIADQLRQEAHASLSNDLLWQPFSSTGIIHLAGSTYLDLLVFPDLDVYYETKNPDHLISTFADAARNLIRCEDVTSIECEKKICTKDTPSKSLKESSYSIVLTMECVFGKSIFGPSKISGF